MTNKIKFENGSAIEMVEGKDTIRSKAHYILGVDIASKQDYSVQVYQTKDENGKLVVKEVVRYRQEMFARNS